MNAVDPSGLEEVVDSEIGDLSWEEFAKRLVNDSDFAESVSSVTATMPGWTYLKRARDPNSPNLKRAEDSLRIGEELDLKRQKLVALWKFERGEPFFGEGSEFDKSRGDALWMPADTWKRPDGGQSVLFVPIPEDGSARVVDARTGRVLYWIYPEEPAGAPAIREVVPFSQHDTPLAAAMKEVDFLRRKGRHDEANEILAQLGKGAVQDLLFALGAAATAPSVGVPAPTNYRTRTIKLRLTHRQLGRLRDRQRRPIGIPLQESRNDDKAPDLIGPNSLESKDVSDIQTIANKFGVRIDVGGSRAQGRGRNIERHDFPADKDPGDNRTRSDIDFIVDVTHKDFPRIMSELRPIGGGAGSLHPDARFLSRHPNAPEESGAGWRFRFEPGQAPQVIRLR